MRRIPFFLVAVAMLLVLANISSAQDRTLGARRLLLDDGVLADPSVYMTNNLGSLGVDNTGTVTPGVFPSQCALLDLSSTTKGFLTPRMSNAQELGICAGTPPEGLIVYNLTTHTLDVYNGSGWGPIGGGWLLRGNFIPSGGTGVGSDYIGTNNAQDFVVATNGVEAARWDGVGATGNLGLGGAPVAGRKLAVTGNALITGNEQVNGQFSSAGNSTVGTTAGTSNTFGNGGGATQNLIGVNATLNNIGSGAASNIFGNSANSNQLGNATLAITMSNTIGQGLAGATVTNSIGSNAGSVTNSIIGNTGNAITLDVSNVANNLTLNNIAAGSNADAAFLDLTTVPSGNVRTRTIGSLITGSQGVEVTYVGSSADAHFASSSANSPFASTRFINSAGQLLNITGNVGGAGTTYASFNGGTDAVGINNNAANTGATTIGNTTAGNNVQINSSTNVSVNGTTFINTGATFAQTTVGNATTNNSQLIVNGSVAADPVGAPPYANGPNNGWDFYVQGDAQITDILKVGTASMIMDPSNNSLTGYNPSGLSLVAGTANANLNLTTSGTGFVNVTGNVIPSVNNTYNLGSPVSVWANIYGTNVFSTALTPGSVVFIGAGGLLTQNNANFFWNNGTARLGIGNNAPAYSVDITGTLRSTGQSDIGTTAGTTNSFGNTGATTNNIGNGSGAANNIGNGGGATANLIGNNANQNQFGINAANNFIAQGGGNNQFGFASASNTFGNSSTINQFGNSGTTNQFGVASPSNTIGTTGTSANTLNGTTNGINASATNTLTGGTGNTMTATTGNNLIQALAAGGLNTITSTATGANNISGPTNINNGVNSATQINTSGSTGATTIGNTAAGGNVSVNTAAANTIAVNGTTNINTGATYALTTIGNGLTANSQLVVNGSAASDLTGPAPYSNGPNNGWDLYVQGDAQVTDILKIGTASMIIDPSTNSFTGYNGTGLNLSAATAGANLTLAPGAGGAINATGITNINTTVLNLTTVGQTGATGQKLLVGGLVDAISTDAAGNAHWDLQVNGDQIVTGMLKTNNFVLTPLTPGSVIFAGVGGQLSQDNVNFFWDAVNHRLGLGTNAPGYQIDVAGTSNFQGLMRADGGVNIIAGGLTEFGGATLSNGTVLNDGTTINNLVVAADDWMTTTPGNLGGTVHTRQISQLPFVGGHIPIHTDNLAVPYGVAVTDYLIISTVSQAGGGTVTLPNAGAVPGKVYVVKRTGAFGANQDVHVQTGGGNIDGVAPPFNLTASNQSTAFASDGASWWIVSN